MIINGKNYRTIWLGEDQKSINIIDQRFLPFKFVIEEIKNSRQMAEAIRDMHLRGAPLIGVAASFGVYLATLEAQKERNFNEYINQSCRMLKATRPTAVNLAWAVERQENELSKYETIEEKIYRSLELSRRMADEDAETCRQIGIHGIKLIEEISEKKNKAHVQILTHCNAGALACVDYGTATAPMFEAKNRNIPIHVWVDETRPRNQGKLTSWELEQSGISNTVICDNTGGHLMQNGRVDIVIVGSDRTTPNGDAANKIGTYLKALAAADNNIPFYVALPSSTIDWNLIHGGKMIPIEERNEDEVLYIEGLLNEKIEKVRLFSNNATALNYSFDVTPARLITGFITEKGICKPDKLKEFFKIYYV